MEPIEIGLVVSGGLLVLVLLGMRVAFAAGLAGGLVGGLIWIFWAKFGYDPPGRFGKAVTVAVKTAGQVPHSKISSQALSLIPTFILIGYLAYYAGLTKALFEAAKRWLAWVPEAGGLDRLCHGGGVCRSVRCVCRNLGGLRPHRHPPRDAENRL